MAISKVGFGSVMGKLGASPEATKWRKPGLSWECEILCLVFVTIAILLPYQAEQKIAADVKAEINYILLRLQAENPGEDISSQEAAIYRNYKSYAPDNRTFFWGLFLAGIYLFHLIYAHSGTNYLSTPVTSLLLPGLFAGIAYYRLAQFGEEHASSQALVSGSGAELVLWVVVATLLALVVARLRMLKHFLRFHEVRWDIVSKTFVDRTFLSRLLLQITPWIYPPRKFYFSTEGLVIEGWFYIMAIPFAKIEATGEVKSPNLLGEGCYLATSTHHMISLKAVDQHKQIFISPQADENILTYCREHMSG